MPPAPKPSDEEERIAQLYDCNILDSLPEEVYDRIVGIASELCTTPIAMFSLVDRERQWFKSRIGIDVQQTPRDVSFCGHAVAANDELLVQDATSDARFCDNALVVSTPNIRFYFGVPVRTQLGQPIGTLCVIDRVPRTLDERQRVALLSLAREIEAHIALRRANQDLATLVDNQSLTSSMLAHDARNLMTSVLSSLELLHYPSDTSEHSSLESAKDAVMQLSRMLQNLVDINSAQPASPTVLEPVDIKNWFDQIVRRESQRAEVLSLCLESKFDCRLALYDSNQQLLDRIIMNLIDNAFHLSPKGGRVRLSILGNEEGFTMTVEDQGPGIPTSERMRIFEPYVHSRTGGTGLGLASCKIAAESLGGQISVADSELGGAAFEVAFSA